MSAFRELHPWTAAALGPDFALGRVPGSTLRRQGRGERCRRLLIRIKFRGGLESGLRRVRMRIRERVRSRVRVRGMGNREVGLR